MSGLRSARVRTVANLGSRERGRHFSRGLVRLTRHHVEQRQLPTRTRLRNGQGRDQILDGAVWFANEVIDRFTQPMIAAGRLGLGVHPLLDDAPLAGGRKDESMVIELKAILHGGRIDFRTHPRGVDEPLALVDGKPLGRGSDLLGARRLVAPFPPATTIPRSAPKNLYASFKARR